MALKLKSRAGQWASSSGSQARYPVINLSYERVPHGWHVFGTFLLSDGNMLKLPHPFPGAPFRTRVTARTAACAWASEQGVPDVIPGRLRQNSSDCCEDVPYMLDHSPGRGWSVFSSWASGQQAFEATFNGVIFPTRSAALAALEAWLELDEQ